MTNKPARTSRAICRLLVANRGEIAIRVLRAASEMGIGTVAIFTHEDRYSLHRYKADESYQIGEVNEPLKPYLDVEAIIKVAKDNQVDAIHPGYGFLSENVHFVKRCREEDIVFVGPDPEVMEQLGDKIAAKILARSVEVPVIEDCLIAPDAFEEALSNAVKIGFPVILKAAAGGGGRGMRVVHQQQDLLSSFREASGEALKAFGNGTIFIEKFIASPKHIEIQLLADNHGNIVHLFERDCSVQRRFQKVVEVAPAPNLPQSVKEKLYEYAVRIGKAVQYNNAGTVEFLVDQAGEVYFIEVNPRIQVEHTVTEEITGIDIVRSQILVAQGIELSDPRIGLPNQESVVLNGFAIQCRITTEDPENNFKPDYGTLIAYRNAGGFGIRLDEGSAYQGMKISPFFDSMIVKVTASGKSLADTARRLHRSLTEFRIRGVATNMIFLENVINHDKFIKGECTVNFIDQHPELFQLNKLKDSSTKVLRYLANIKVNGHANVKEVTDDHEFRTPVIPPIAATHHVKGSKDLLSELGRESFMKSILQDQKIHYTDTTYRDAHQSLLATRMRTKDILTVADGYTKDVPELFSAEVWGGATFDVALRFLHECPWQRLQRLRKAMPNVLLQMLFRGSNAVGYSAYPKNIVEKFIDEAWTQGIDIFRIFDSLNNVSSMLPTIQHVVQHTEALAQPAICYTGNVLHKESNKYDLQYYLDLARRLEDAGAHMIAIKDMAGLLKPDACTVLVSALRENINLPIALHTHDTAGTQLATYLNAIDAGIDSVDCALASFSGTTSQPSLNSLVALMEGRPRENALNLEKLNAYSDYWEIVRDMYYPFESDLKTSTAEVYKNEIPGGQYSNLRQQAEGVGLGAKLLEIKSNYAIVNQLFGGIVKVTPSSKVVGDMALFMTANSLTADDVLDENKNLSFPASVIGFFKGELGVPYGGFPEQLRKIVLRNEHNKDTDQNSILPDVDLEASTADFYTLYPESTFLDYLSYQMFPKVFDEYYQHKSVYGDVTEIPTEAFFYPLAKQKEISVRLRKGKEILIRLMYVSNPDEEGMRMVSFQLNGGNRTVRIKDHSVSSTKMQHEQVRNPIKQEGAPLQGNLSAVLVREGDLINAGDPLFVIEAMKMESTVVSSVAGLIKRVVLPANTIVDQNDLIIEFE